MTLHSVCDCGCPNPQFKKLGSKTTEHVTGGKKKKDRPLVILGNLVGLTAVSALALSPASGPSLTWSSSPHTLCVLLSWTYKLRVRDGTFADNRQSHDVLVLFPHPAPVPCRAFAQALSAWISFSASLVSTPFLSQFHHFLILRLTQILLF